MVQYHKSKSSQNSALKSPPYERNQKINFNIKGNNPFFQFTKTFSSLF